MFFRIIRLKVLHIIIFSWMSSERSTWDKDLQIRYFLRHRGVNRERVKTSKRKKCYQVGHQCKQPVIGSTLMSSSENACLREKKGETLRRFISCRPIGHRWRHTLISPTLLDCTCVRSKQVPGDSVVSEKPQKGRQRHSATLRWGFASRKWVKIFAELCVVAMAEVQGKSKRMKGVDGRCPIQQTELMQRRASQGGEGILQTTSSEEWRWWNHRNNDQCVSITQCVPLTHLSALYSPSHQILPTAESLSFQSLELLRRSCK